MARSCLQSLEYTSIRWKKEGGGGKEKDMVPVVGVALCVNGSYLKGEYPKLVETDAWSSPRIGKSFVLSRVQATPVYGDAGREEG